MSLYPALAATVAVIALTEARSWLSPEHSLFSEHLPPVAVTCLALLVSYFFVPSPVLIALCLLASVTLLWQAAAPFKPRSMWKALCIGWLASEVYTRTMLWQVFSLHHGLHMLIPAVSAGLVLWLLPRSTAARMNAAAGFALWSAASAAVLFANAISGTGVERGLITACDRTWSVVAVVCAVDVLAAVCSSTRKLYRNPQYTIRLTAKHVLEHNE